ncbi:YbjQ family protein [Halovivax sp.]|uniref:YbjQ family protein n=1 Tax=Halovivax sp. TaxID=1935978 RepID=UPI00374310CF
MTQSLDVATTPSDAREEACWRLEERVEEAGGDAVIDVTFESASIPGGGIELLVYGTAVRVERTFCASHSVQFAERKSSLPVRRPFSVAVENAEPTASWQTPTPTEASKTSGRKSTGTRWRSWLATPSPTGCR